MFVDFVGADDGLWRIDCTSRSAQIGISVRSVRRNPADAGHLFEQLRVGASSSFLAAIARRILPSFAS